MTSRYSPRANAARASCTAVSTSAIVRRSAAWAFAGVRGPSMLRSFAFASASAVVADVERALRIGARDGLMVGRLACRILRALAAVQCVVEREPIIALGDGVLCFFQGILRGCVLVARVAVGAGRPRGVDRALRLLHLFLRGIAAACERTGDHERDRCEQAANRRHERTSIRREITDGSRAAESQRTRVRSFTAV